MSDNIENNKNKVDEVEKLKNLPKEELEKLVLNSEEFKLVVEELEGEEYNDSEEDLNLRELVKNWDYIWAINEFFSIIWRFFKWSGEIWYEQFDNIWENIDFDSMEISEIENYIIYTKAKIQKSNSICRKLWYTKLLSNAKDSISKKNNPDADNIDLLIDNVEVGNILLLNKKKDNWVWTKLLRIYEDDNSMDFTHSVLVTEKNWELYITQATLNKEDWTWSGIEETPLKKYLENHKPAEILALKQPDYMKESSLNFAKEKIWLEYDNRACYIMMIIRNKILQYNISK